VDITNIWFCMTSLEDYSVELLYVVSKCLAAPEIYEPSDVIKLRNAVSPFVTVRFKQGYVKSVYKVKIYLFPIGPSGWITHSSTSQKPKLFLSSRLTFLDDFLTSTGFADRSPDRLQSKKVFTPIVFISTQITFSTSAGPPEWLPGRVLANLFHIVLCTIISISSITSSLFFFLTYCLVYDY